VEGTPNTWARSCAVFRRTDFANLVTQYLTLANPLRHFLEIVRGIFLKGNGLGILWPQMLALLAIGTRHSHGQRAPVPARDRVTSEIDKASELISSGVPNIAGRIILRSQESFQES